MLRALCSFVFALVVHLTPAVPLFRFDFENGFSVLQQENELKRPDAITIVRDPLNNGNKCVRFTAYANDTTSECGECQRAELKIYRDTFSAEMLKTYTYSARVMIDPGWQFSGDRWLTLLQWHDIPDPGGEVWRHPIMMLSLLNDHWTVLWRWCADRTQTVARDQWKERWQAQIAEPPQGRWLELPAAADLGKWVRWVFVVRWDYGPEGVLKVYKDGTKVLDRVGPIGYNDVLGPTCKFGLYRSQRYDSAPFYGKYYDRVLFVDDYMVDTGDLSDSIEPGALVPGALVAPLVQFDFEDGYDTLRKAARNLENVHLAYDPVRRTTATAWAEPGICVRFRLKASDSVPGCGDCQRAELQLHSSYFVAKPLETYTYSVDILLAADWKFGGDRWLSVLQWRSRVAVAVDEPPLLLGVVDDHWVLVWLSAETTVDDAWQAHKTQAPKGRWLESVASADLGKWTRWVIVVRWDTGPNGVLYAFKNGRQLLRHKGSIGRETQDKPGVLCTMGLLRPGATTPTSYDRLMYIDNYTVYHGDRSAELLKPVVLELAQVPGATSNETSNGTGSATGVQCEATETRRGSNVYRTFFLCLSAGITILCMAMWFVWLRCKLSAARRSTDVTSCSRVSVPAIPVVQV